MANYIDGMEGGKHNSDETECRSPRNFEIKITGEGERKHIINALYELIRSLDSYEANEHELDGCEWEDSVLMTEISEI